MSIRPVLETRSARPVVEGAGVRLHRAFGFGDPERLDPFLLLDDFGSDRPEDWRAGFPWHPHRGIETITYVLAGEVEHADSLGNAGRIGAGDVQWMTAGSGILHQEMPAGDAAGRMHGFQLWANLPSSLKMSRPAYRDIRAEEIPEVIEDDGTRARVVAGEWWGRRGPVAGVATDPVFVDISMPPGARRRFAIDTRRNAFAYVFAGSGRFADAAPPVGVLLETSVAGRELLLRDPSGARTLVRFGGGDEIVAEAGPEGMRFLLVAGVPIREPVAWHGPIVMNTREELIQAFRELREGRFIREGAAEPPVR